MMHICSRYPRYPPLPLLLTRGGGELSPKTADIGQNRTLQGSGAVFVCSRAKEGC